MNVKPLDDLEMFELLQIAYPEKFADDTDETWDKAQEFADNFYGFEQLADLLARVVMMTMPVESPLSGVKVHAIGKIEELDAGYSMTGVVRRKTKEQSND